MKLLNKIRYICLSLFPFICYSQGRNVNWCFGDSSGVNFSNITSPTVFSTGMDGRGSCVSISEANGALTFYAFTRAGIASGNTTIIYNGSNQQILNGDSIVGNGWYNELVIIPMPSNDSLYYLFSIGGISNNMSIGLYYTVINKNGNNGVGEVIQKNFNLQLFRTVDCLTAIKHGNGRDWWILFRRYSWQNGGNNEWHVLLVGPGGISNYNIQNIGLLNSTNAGRICVSKLGTEICFLNFAGIIELYDFNRCTGMLGMHQIIEQQAIMTYPHYLSCAFSSDGSKLYVTSTSLSLSDSSYVYQYDLDASNIQASKDTIWDVSFPASLGFIKLAPDNKIYLSCAYDNWLSFYYPYPDSIRNYINENLSVISSPDSLGAACDFQPFSFYLGGKRTYHGLPNNPDYDLGPLTGSPCDTLTGTGPAPGPSRGGKGELFLTWASDWEKLFVNAQHIKGRNCQLQIFDINGKAVFSLRMQTAPPYFTQNVHLPGLAAGMYVVRLGTEKEQLSGKFVVE